MKWIWLFLWLLSLAGLIWAIGWERHTVYSLATEKAGTLSGEALIEATTVDGLIRREDRLYDIYSLTPETSDIKDCKT